MKKRILSTIISIILLICSFPFTSYAYNNNLINENNRFPITEYNLFKFPYTTNSIDSMLTSATETAIYDYLKYTMGLNTAAVCGILANIEKESDFNPHALGDSGTSYGICQWHNTRWTDLKNYCNNNGYDWTTIYGQVRFFFF